MFLDRLSSHYFEIGHNPESNTELTDRTERKWVLHFNRVQICLHINLNLQNVLKWSLMVRREAKFHNLTTTTFCPYDNTCPYTHPNVNFWLFDLVNECCSNATRSPYVKHQSIIYFLGPSRGKCGCGKCECADGHTGNNCGCPTTNTTCLASDGVSS